MLSKLSQKQKGIFSIVLRFIGLAIGIASIILHMSVNSLLTTGFMVNHNLAYFTLQTNIFSVSIFLILLIQSFVTLHKEHEVKVAYINPTLHLACTMYITITMIVYWLVLTPVSGPPQNVILLLDGLGLHLITPLLAIIDCLLFSNHGKVSFKAIPKLLIYPVLYYISVIIVSQCITEPYYTLKIHGEDVGLMYPYPFLDPNIIGVGGVVLAVIALVVFFILFSMLYIWLDGKLRK